MLAIAAFIFMILCAASFLVAMISSIPAMVGMIYFAVKTSRATVERNVAASLPLLLRGNSFNVILMPSLLTPAGLEYRRKLIRCFLWFVLPILATFLFLGIAKVIAHAGGISI